MKKIMFFGWVLILVFIACTRDSFIPTAVDCDENAPPTYDETMQEIVDMNCSYSGCHDGVTPGVPGDYTTYSGMQMDFGGSIMDRVISRTEDPVLGMPPNYATEGPIDLSEEHMIMFTCWINAEFPEN
jgi:hypothetical protein